MFVTSASAGSAEAAFLFILYPESAFTSRDSGRIFPNLPVMDSAEGLDLFVELAFGGTPVMLCLQSDPELFFHSNRYNLNQTVILSIM